MTNLKRAVKRRTDRSYRNRSLIVELHPMWLSIREQGRPRRCSSVDVDYAAIFEFAMKIKVRKEQAEKQAAKKARRG